MIRPHDQQPIAALSSGSGPGAVGVIRISGTNCWRIVSTCLKNPRMPEKRRASLRSLQDPKTAEIIDEVVLIYFAGPESFTGQDTVEIFCHGGPYVIQRILGLLYELGARPADPGEFTKRALLAGKLDLTAAEGIKDLVEAQSRQQWLAGRQLYCGKLKSQIDELRREIIGAMAYLEAMIDFPDEGDTQHVGLEHVRSRIKVVNIGVETLIETFRSGKIASRGLMVALAGAPNAGKSTLLNELLGKNRAIVSDIPGTTRDYIEEPCLIDGRLIRLVDTAGIRDTKDQIEKAGVQLSASLIAEADLVIALMASDSTEAQRRELEEVLAPHRSKLLNVVTKVDMGRPTWSDAALLISCHSGEGLSDLRKNLASIVDDHTGSLEEKPFLTSLRQQNALIASSEALRRFAGQDQAGAGHEMLAFELQEAARSLSAVIGDISNEDILDKVFSEFCIGK
jgi:tRNA modification GTPase